jgi:hypothetical protein
MKNAGNGGDWRDQTNGEPRRPKKALTVFARSPGAALFLSTALLAVSFLIHIFFLFLVEPLRYLNIPKEDAMMYSGIPLCVGIVFLAIAIYNFVKIKPRSALHIIALVFVLAFGSLSLQGLAGIFLHLAHVSSHRV